MCIRTVQGPIRSLTKKVSQNKKVLLRERKRHTACCIAGWEGGVDRHTDTCQNITFPHHSDAGGKKMNGDSGYFIGFFEA